MIKVLLPVAAPGIVTTLIFIFINAWNEYTVALCLISTDTIKPLTVGINIFNGCNIIEWQYLFAASIFAIVPVVILFMSIEKNLTSGLTAVVSRVDLKAQTVPFQKRHRFFRLDAVLIHSGLKNMSHATFLCCLLQ